MWDLLLFGLSNLLAYMVIQACQAQEDRGWLKAICLTMIIIIASAIVGLNVGTVWLVWFVFKASR